MTHSHLSERIGRPALWINRMRKRFGFPSLEDYPECYEAFLRKLRDINNLGVSEGKLGELWDLERKLIEILHLDIGSGEFSLIEGCGAGADPDCRLLLSNVDLGVPLMALDVQTGLDFQTRPRELFEGNEMGEDALRILVEYRELLQVMRETICREIKVLKGSLRWAKSLGFAGR